jgi:hypothetical protein
LLVESGPGRALFSIWLNHDWPDSLRATPSAASCGTQAMSERIRSGGFPAAEEAMYLSSSPL